MASSTMAAVKRNPDTNLRALRRMGKVPAVIYGQQGTESLSVELDWKDVETFLKDAVVNNTVCDLKVQRGWSGKVLLREVQLDVLKRKPLHLSFFALAGHGSIHLDVPLVFTGEPVGVRIGRGLLDRSLTHLSIMAGADQIPDAIEVDVSHMEVGDIFYVSDLVLPAGVEATNSGDTPVVLIAPSLTGRELESIDTEEAADASTADSTETSSAAD